MAAADSLPSPSPLETKESESKGFPMDLASPPLAYSLSLDKRVWSALQRHADGIIEKGSLGSQEGDGRVRSKEDSMLLLRGFDSIACTLSQLSEDIENALQGARELAKPPTLTEIFHSRDVRQQKEQEEEKEKKKPPKRKFESSSSRYSDDQGDKSDALEDNNRKRLADANLKKAKNVWETVDFAVVYIWLQLFLLFRLTIMTPDAFFFS